MAHILNVYLRIYKEYCGVTVVGTNQDRLINLYFTGPIAAGHFKSLGLITKKKRNTVSNLS